MTHGTYSGWRLGRTKQVFSGDCLTRRQNSKKGRYGGTTETCLGAAVEWVILVVVLEKELKVGIRLIFPSTDLRQEDKSAWGTWQQDENVASRSTRASTPAPSLRKRRLTSVSILIGRPHSMQV
jgi:hypothetical protein